TGRPSSKELLAMSLCPAQGSKTGTYQGRGCQEQMESRRDDVQRQQVISTAYVEARRTDGFASLPDRSLPQKPLRDRLENQAPTSKRSVPNYAIAKRTMPHPVAASWRPSLARGSHPARAQRLVRPDTRATRHWPCPTLLPSGRRTGPAPW